MTYLIIGIGGIFGSIARFSIGKAISEKVKSNFPMGTFLINITGAFLLGIVSGLELSANIYSLLADGFLGAFTTFSTFMYEGFNLFQEEEKMNAFSYVALSLLIGVIGYWAGFKLIRFI